MTKTTKPVYEMLGSNAMGQMMAKLCEGHPRLDVDRMIVLIKNAIRRTPTLADCSAMSVGQAIVKLCAAGLEPDGRNAHLIPFKDECQLIIDYKGYVQLIWDSGYAKEITAQVVYEGDFFDVQMGKVVHHLQWEWMSREFRSEEKGDPIGAYVIIENCRGGSHHEIMSIEEIYAIRDRSPGYRRSDSPWRTDPGEMIKKTPMRRAVKWIPLKQAAIEVIAEDDRSTAVVEQPQATGVLEHEGTRERVRNALLGYDEGPLPLKIETPSPEAVTTPQDPGAEEAATRNKSGSPKS